MLRKNKRGFVENSDDEKTPNALDRLSSGILFPPLLPLTGRKDTLLFVDFVTLVVMQGVFLHVRCYKPLPSCALLFRDEYFGCRFLNSLESSVSSYEVINIHLDMNSQMGNLRQLFS